MTARWSIAAKFDGEFASSSQTYGGSGTLRYTWWPADRARRCQLLARRDDFRMSAIRSRWRKAENLRN